MSSRCFRLAAITTIAKIFKLLLFHLKARYIYTTASEKILAQLLIVFKQLEIELLIIFAEKYKHRYFDI